MIAQRINFFLHIYRILDLAVVVLAYFAAFFLTAWFVPESGLTPAPWQGEWPMALSAMGLWALLLQLNRVYSSQRGRHLSGLFLSLVKANFQGLVTLIGLIFFLELPWRSRAFLLVFTALSTLLLILEKALVMRWLELIRRSGRNLKEVLLVGANDLAREVILKVRQSPEAGLHVKGVVVEELETVGESFEDAPVLGAMSGLTDVLHGHVIDEVIICLPLDRIEKIHEALVMCETMGLEGRVATRLFDPTMARIYYDELVNIPLFTITTQPRRDLAFRVKQLIDFFGSLVLILLLSPLFLALAIGIKVTSPGPVFFTQERMGYNGRRFRMVKFRSMVTGADKMQETLRARNEADGPLFKMRHDPRVTPFGEFIRKTSLDELPQIFNVFIGDMSLIGPRPLPVAEALQIKNKNRRRVSMKPGMTGLWQVSGRSNTTYERMIELDLQYIDTWSLWLDFRIFFKTAWIMISRHGAF